MKLPELYEKLEELFTIDEYRSIVSALSIDPIAWSAINDKVFLDNFIQHYGNQKEAWTIAGVLLFPLGVNVERARLYINGEDHLINDSDVDNIPSVVVYTKAMRGELTPYLASEAGMLTLELIKSLAEYQTVSKLLERVLSHSDISIDENRIARIWKTAFAGLFDLIPNRHEFLLALLKSKRNTAANEIYVHALLANQLDDTQIVDLVSHSLIDADVTTQVTIIRALYQSRYRKAVKSIAGTVVNKSVYLLNETLSKDFERPVSSDVLNDITRYKAIGDLYHLADESQMAFGMYQLVEKLTKQFLDGVSILTSEIGEVNSDNSSDELSQIVESHYDRQLKIAASSVYVENKNDAIKDIEPTQPGETLQHLANAEYIKDSIVTNPYRLKNSLISAYVSKLKIDKLPDGYFEYSNPVTQLIPVEPEPAMKLLEAEIEKEKYQNALDIAYQVHIYHPNNLDVIRKIAWLHDKTKNHHQAVNFLQKITSLNSGTIDDYLNLGRSNNALGDLQKAKGAFSKAVQLNGDCGLAYAYLGKVYSDLGDDDLAEINLKHSVTIAPFEEQTWLLLANYYDQNGNHEELLATLRSAVISIPKSQSIKLDLAEFLINSGDTDEGTKIFREAIISEPDSKELVKRAAGLVNSSLINIDLTDYIVKAYDRWPNDIEILTLYAKNQNDAGNLQKAINVLVNCHSEQFTPEFVNVAVSQLMGIWLQDTSFTSAFNDFSDRLEKHIVSEIEADCENADYELDLADLRLIKGDNDGAESLYFTLVNHLDDHLAYMSWRVHRGLAIFAAKSGNIDGALAALNTSLQSKPDESTLHLLNAKINFQGRRFYEAYKASERLLDITHNSSDTLNWVLKQMADAKQYDRAIDLLTRALGQSPNDLDLNLKLVTFHIQSGAYKAAAKLLSSLVPVYFEDQEALKNISYCYHEMRDEHRALEIYQQAINNNQTLASDESFVYGYLLFVNEKYSDAHDVIERARKSYPGEKIFIKLLAEIAVSQNEYEVCLENIDQLSASEIQITAIPQSIILQQIAQKIVYNEHLKLFTEPIGLVYRRLKCHLLLKHYKELRQITEDELKNYPDDLVLLNYLTYTDTVDNKFESLASYEVINDLGKSLSTNGTESGSLAEILVRKILVETRTKGLSQLAKSILLLRKIESASPYSRLIAIWEDSESQEKQATPEIINHLVDGSLGTIPQNSQNDLAQKLTLAPDFSLELRTEIVTRILCSAFRWNDALQYLSATQARLEHQAVVERLRIDILKDWYYMRHVAEECNVSSERLNSYQIAPRFKSELLENLKSEDLPGTETKFGLLNWLTASTFDHRSIISPEIENVISKTNDKILHVFYLYQKHKYAQALDRLPADYSDPISVMIRSLIASKLDLPETLTSSQSALQGFHSNPIALYLLSSIKQNLGNPEDALQLLVQAIEIWPGENYWIDRAINLAVSMGDTYTERAILELCTSFTSGSSEQINRLSELYLGEGKGEKALSLLERHVADYPNDVDSWLHLAQVIEQSGDLNSVIIVVKRALGKNPDSQKLSNTYGKYLYLSKDYSNAESICKQSIQRNPDDITPRFILIDTYIAVNKYQEADHQLNQITAKAIKDDSVLSYYVHLLIMVRGVQIARSVLNSYLEGKGIEFSDAINIATAEVEFYEGDLDSAEQHALKAFSSDNTNDKLIGLLGKINRKLGNLDQAVNFFSKSINSVQPELDYFLEFGQTYIDRREQKKALEIYKQAIFHYPERPEAYYKAAQVFREFKDYLSAEMMLRKAAKIAPNDLNIHRQLGAIIALNLVHNN